MTDKIKPELSGAAMTHYQQMRTAARQAALAACGGSSLAMESTLAQISDEVTEEAVERLRLKALGR